MKRMNKTKSILALALVALLLTCAIGGSVAYLVTNTEPLTNTFTPGKVTCQVIEDFTKGGTTKSNVRIKNTGNTDAWIRATVVGNWVVGTGNDKKIVAPWNDDIQTYNTGDTENKWTKGTDGYYYYNSIVLASQNTENLFSSYEISGKPPVDGAHLELTIVCQAVQSNLGSNAKDAFAAAKKNPASATN